MLQDKSDAIKNNVIIIIIIIIVVNIFLKVVTRVTGLPVNITRGHFPTIPILSGFSQICLKILTQLQKNPIWKTCLHKIVFLFAIL